MIKKKQKKKSKKILIKKKKNLNKKKKNLNKKKMSIILQIGQCGNQLGCEFFSLLTTLPNPKRFFHNPPSKSLTANAILIDMEPKVITSILKKKKNFFYNKNYIFTKEEGSGNNWAFGYEKHGKNAKLAILGKIKHLMEKMDNFDSFIFLQSMAGGTGSGLGSFLVEFLRSIFENCFFINFLVAPKKGGEVIIQNYNCVFSFSTIYQNCDFVFILKNDRAEKICKKVFKMEKINMDAINSILAKDIIVSLLTDSGFTKSKKKQNKDFLDNLNFLKPLPSLKLLGTRFLPHVDKKLKSFFTETWKGLLNKSFQMQINGKSEANINWLNPLFSKNIIKSYSSLITLNSKKIFEEFKEEKNPFFLKNIFSKNFQKINFEAHFFERELFQVEKSIGLLTNSQEFVGFFDEVFFNGKNMFGQKAYLYQYKKFGLEEDSMEDLFLYFDHVNRIYKDM